METTARSRARKPATAAPARSTTPLWLCLNSGATITCGGCARRLYIAQALVINAESLRKGFWQLVCACNHLFTVEEFVDSGACLKRGRAALTMMTH